MRLKKYLNERMEACKSVLLAREGDEFYKLTNEQRNFVVNLADVFQNDNDLYLELGCGKGAYAIQSALLHPDRNYIALEKLSNVIVVACENAIKQQINNLRFLNCRAENLLWFLPQHCAKEIILNFSCPFPKKTYANRRLTSPNYLALYKQILKRDGIIVQKTDDLPFFEYSIETLKENGYDVFDVKYDLPVDAPENIVTEYEAKFRSIEKKIYALKAKLK